MMHDREKSHSAIVAAKPTNKAGVPAAEPVEPRAGTERNAGEQSTHRTQSRVAELAAIGAGDLAKIDFVPHNAQHKASEMALGNEIRHCHRQQQRLFDLPRAKCLAHAQGQNLTRASLASKIRLLLRQAPRR